MAALNGLEIKAEGDDIVIKITKEVWLDLADYLDNQDCPQTSAEVDKDYRRYQTAIINSWREDKVEGIESPLGSFLLGALDLE